MISIITITQASDAEMLDRMIQSLPTGVEVCIVMTEKSKEESFEITDEYEHEGRSYRVALWKYKIFDFSTARNHSLDIATNDWCLWMDSDDVMLHSQHEEILGIEKLPSGVGGVLFGCFGFQAEWMPKDDGDYYANSHLRAFKKSTGARFRGRVHEQIADSISEAGWKITKSAILIAHLGYADLNKEQFLKKLERNIDLLVIQLATDTYARDYYRECLAKSLFMQQKLKE